MPLLALVAATSIACINPAHSDGQSIRCGENAPTIRLEGITAPSVAAACNNFNCADDPGIASRDHLADLTRGQSLVCAVTESRAGRRRERTARCTMGGLDLSCAMVADGMAEKSGPLICPANQKTARENVQFSEQARDILELPPLWRYIPLFLVFANIAAYAAFAIDHHRAARAMRRVSPTHLLALTFIGGGLGGLIAVVRFGYLRDETPFINQFAVLLGLQLGAAIGVFGLLMT